jgi:hypothetical protein
MYSSEPHLSSVQLFVTVLEKTEFKDESQFFRFYADEEMEGTNSKSKQLQRNDFKLIENILVKSLVVSVITVVPPLKVVSLRCRI